MKPLLFVFCSLLVSFPAVSQVVVNEVTFPVNGNPDWIEASPNGQIWVAMGKYLLAQTNSSPDAPFVVVSDKVSQGGYYNKTIDGRSQLVLGGFFPDNGNTIVLGETHSNAIGYKNLETVATINPPGTTQVCKDYIVDGGKTLTPPTITGPQKTLDGKILYYVGRDNVSSRILLRGKTELSGICSLSTVATINAPVLQAWPLPNPVPSQDVSFFLEIINSVDPVNWYSTSFGVWKNGVLTMLVSPNRATNPQILATLSGDMTIDWGNGIPSVSYRISSGGHTFIYQNGQIKEVYANEDGLASQCIRVFGLRGKWLIIAVGSKSPRLWDQLLLVNTITKERWPICPSDIKCGYTTVRPDGIVFFQGRKAGGSIGDIKLYRAVIPGITGIQLSPPVIDAVAPVLTGGTIIVTGKNLTVAGTTATILLQGNPIATLQLGPDKLSGAAPTKAGVYTLQVKVSNPSTGETLLSNIVELTVNEPTPPPVKPVFMATSVVDNASGLQPCSPGSLCSVYGRNLAEVTAKATGTTWPTTLGGTQVLINGTAAPPYYVSANQINFQMPLEVKVFAGIANMQISRGQVLSDIVPITVVQAAGGVYQSVGLAIMQDALTYALAGMTPGDPLVGGSIAIAYLTGLGLTECDDVATGQPSPPRACPTVLQPTVSIGGQRAQVLYSGLTPGYIGLYQINFLVPGKPPTNQSSPVLATVEVSIAGNKDSTAKTYYLFE